MFDSDNPDHSDLVEGTLEDGIPYADDDDDEDASGLEILDDAGEPLGGDDVEDLEGAGKQKGDGDTFENAPSSAPDDYDVLV